MILVCAFFVYFSVSELTSSIRFSGGFIIWIVSLPDHGIAPLGFFQKSQQTTIQNLLQFLAIDIREKSHGLSVG